MSHFPVLIQVPKEASNVREYVEEVLAPYDENKEVPEYDDTCYCVGRAAKDGVREAANREFGTLGEIREKFWTEHEDKKLPYPERDADKEEVQKYLENKDMLDKLWKERIKPVLEFEDKMLSQHSLREQTSADCEECGGTGLYKTTYNPDSKWDWWCIGGRWHGYLTENMPNDGDDWRAHYRRIDQGFQSNFKPNALLGVAARARSERDPSFRTFAFIDKSGAWHERGQMGWWACVSNEKDSDTWKKEFNDFINSVDDEDFIVLVDCHI